MISSLPGGFIYRERLEDLAARAAAAVRGLWEEARTLVPVQSEQYQSIGRHLAALADETPASSRSPGHSDTGKSWWSRSAAAALTIGVLLIGKFKFLLLGLTKLSTFGSMFGFIAVYWSIHLELITALRRLRTSRQARRHSAS